MVPEVPDARRDRIRRLAMILLFVYVVAGSLVAFWPEPVDRGASDLIAAATRVIPWATYGRIEFTANIVFFVPLGLLLSIVLDRHRHLVLPIGIVTTVSIEALQSMMLTQRTASVYDVLANTTGTSVGMLIAAVVAPRLIRARPTPHRG